ncbi:hypothetical protein [Fervidibacillus halotolerans]|uniref:Uncharacterized protein n=1 Tax=Fervidibacillus halotolerans TaxID=2980027 RepID=A0A9E8S156_9BACI|nr:hypothetical protein [Fervidibacillus halotolerans]WAA13187.1 hypothetical protein OE105_03390 [Fervidibacillus halotolerans]
MDKATLEKEEMIIQALRIQYSVLQLMDRTLHETYLYEKGLPEKLQNEEVIHLTERMRKIIGRKPKLKEIYRKLEEEYHIKLSN